MYHLWVKMIDLIFVILFGTIILITRIKNKPIVRNYRISKIDIHFNRKLHRWQVSWEVKYQLLVHRVPDKLLIDRLLGTVEILTHVSHDNKRKHCGVDCLVKSRKVKRNYAKTQLPCTLGGVSRNIFMETIRLANFSCMYINVRFVTIASRDCPFLKASKRLNFLISSRMKRTFLVRWRKIFPWFYSIYFSFQHAYFPFHFVYSQYAIALLALLSLLQQPIESWVSERWCFNRILHSVLFLCNRKKVIIHVPYRVKNVKHVHTIYKIIPHYREDKKEDFEEDEKYEIY